MYDENWQQHYQHRLLTSAQAIAKVAPGRRILIGSGAAEPTSLVTALVEHGEHLADNPIVHLLTLGPAPYVRPEFSDRFRHAAFFIGGNTREAVQAGRADFIPIFLSEIPRLISARRLRIDVVLLQVSPPDQHGYVSLGVSVDVIRAAVSAAELVIAEVNPRMPRTFGDAILDVRELDYLVAVDTPVLELPSETADDVSQRIGQNVAALVPDGATIQTGIGKIPDAILRALAKHSDLGVHTEMFSDGILQLVESGVVTGRRKTLLPNKIVSSFVMGSRRLYDWLNDNPSVELRGSDFTNDPLVIAQNDNMVAINSALAVDLTGQVAADTLAGRFFSGIGGQVDFIRGAARSRGGKPIIALPSTARNGTISRIQATFEAGAGVVTSRGDVHYVVTEYGVADLWGKTVRERATALMEIAHPAYRADLLNAAKERRYVFPEQRIPSLPPACEELRTCKLANGKHVTIRPARMADEDGVQAFLYRLSRETSYERFHGCSKYHSRKQVVSLVRVDPRRSAAYVVELPESDGGDIIALGRYDLDPSTQLGEIGIVVADAFQRQGLGRALLERLITCAHDSGLAGLKAEILPENGAMLALCNKSGLRVENRFEHGLHIVTMSIV